MTPLQRTFLIDTTVRRLDSFWKETNTSSSDAKTFILFNLKEELKSSSSQKRLITDRIIWLAIILPDSDLKLQILHELLLMTGHFSHQVVTREIQDIGSPLSIPYLDQALESGFDYIKRTHSGESDASIAKWFSHALESIGTDAAFEVLEKHSLSTNFSIAAEMRYRLGEL